MTTAGQVRRINVLGLPVAATDIAGVVSIFDQWIANRQREYVTVTGAHGVVESMRDPELAAIHRRAGLIVPDGMPLVWHAWIRGAKNTQRCYGPDVMLAVLERSGTAGHRHFLYGGGEGVAELLERKLRERFPDLQICGRRTPPYRDLTDAESAEIAAAINAAAPDIVWVGLSTPKQERWMAAFRDRLKAPVLVGVGAAFDFHAGLKPQAPRILQRNGLEWAYRLVTEPKRLWRRYFDIVPTFFFQSVLQLGGIKHFGDQPAVKPGAAGRTGRSEI